MEPIGHATVTILSPSKSLLKDHHGPPQARTATNKKGTSSTSSSSCPSSSCSTPSSSTEPPLDPISTWMPTPTPKPKYFKNPWSSYRTATLSDAWLAYQKGAALVLPRPKSPETTESEGTPPPELLSQLQQAKGKQSDTRSPSHPADDDFTDTASTLYDAPGLNEINDGPSKVSKRHSTEDDDEDDWRDPPVKVVPPQWGGVELGNDKETVTWLGHAGVFVQIPWQSQLGDQDEDGKGKGKRQEGMCGVIFDPIFSYRCSPSQYAGPARYLDPPCPVSLLPDVHICCISHDHYDHLDYNTVMDLWKYHGSTVHFFVPLGLKDWFLSSGIPSSRVTELDWWHESLVTFSAPPPLPSSNQKLGSEYPPTDPSSQQDSATQDETLILTSKVSEKESKKKRQSTVLRLKIAFTPAQHRSGRGLMDHMTTLWGSWCVGVVAPEDLGRCRRGGMRDWKGFKVFFGGDTGYRYATAPEGDETAICPAFREISSLYSPFSLSLLPLSTGSSLPFLRNLLSLSLDQYTLTSSLHCSPADSLDIHTIIQAERSLGIHWGTFCEPDESRGTRVEFGRVRREKGVSGSWNGGEGGVGSAKGGDKGSDVEGKGRFVVRDIGETLVFP